MELTFAQKENIGFQYVLEAMEPSSPYGRQLLRELRPLGPGCRGELQRQLGNVHRILQMQACRRELQQLLRIFMGLKMVRPTAQKCLETELNAIELFEMKRFLLQSLEMLPLFAAIGQALGLEGITMADTRAALDILDPDNSRTASFFIPDTVSQTLASLRREKRMLEAQIREAPSQELVARRREVCGMEETEEQRIHGVMSRQLRPYIPSVLSNMDAIADLDLTAEKARIAALYGGCFPELTESRLELTDMCNPRIVDLLAAQKKTFTPISIKLAQGTTVITGANMGGKSVALKTIALNILLVHCGFFPFAGSARIPLFDGMHIISEDLESVNVGLSSFGGEIVRFNRMAGQLETGFHFVLLDEFARGTNPQEGAAIVRAVTQYLNGRPAISVLATHYDHVSDVARAHYQVAGLRDLDWDALRREIRGLSQDESAGYISRFMNYGLYAVEKALDCPRDALHICRLLGMEREIVEEAEETVSARVKIC